MQPTDTPQNTARARLALRARRMSMIRRRVAATSLATFVLAFGAISQTGSLGATTRSTPGATSIASSTPISATTDAAAAVSTSPTSSANASGQAAAVSAVTTRQS